MNNSWCIVTPFGKDGFLGESKAGKVYGTNRLSVILQLIAITFMSTEEEEVCPECQGTGEVHVLSKVYANEPHVADLGDTVPCHCQDREEEFDDQEPN
jgi:RecJ-like exonuclease